MSHAYEREQKSLSNIEDELNSLQAAILAKKQQVDISTPHAYSPFPQQFIDAERSRSRQPGLSPNSTGTGRSPLSLQSRPLDLKEHTLRGESKIPQEILTSILEKRGEGSEGLKRFLDRISKPDNSFLSTGPEENRLEQEKLMPTFNSNRSNEASRYTESTVSPDRAHNHKQGEESKRSYSREKRDLGKIFELIKLRHNDGGSSRSQNFPLQDSNRASPGYLSFSSEKMPEHTASFTPNELSDERKNSSREEDDPAKYSDRKENNVDLRKMHEQRKHLVDEVKNLLYSLQNRVTELENKSPVSKPQGRISGRQNMLGSSAVRPPLPYSKVRQSPLRSKSPDWNNTQLQASEMVNCQLGPYQRQIEVLKAKIDVLEDRVHSANKENRVMQGQMLLLKEEKRRHLDQNALDREKWNVERVKLEQNVKVQREENEELREENEKLKDDLREAKQQIPAMESQLKRLKNKFEEEMKASRRLMNVGEKKERMKDEQHRERVRELKEKLGATDVQLRELQEKYKVETSRFQALVGAQRQTIDFQKEKIKDLESAPRLNKQDSQSTLTRCKSAGLRKHETPHHDRNMRSLRSGDVRKSPLRMSANTKAVISREKLQSILKPCVNKLHHSESRHRLERSRHERERNDHRFLNTSEFLPAHRSVLESQEYSPSERNISFRRNSDDRSHSFYQRQLFANQSIDRYPNERSVSPQLNADIPINGSCESRKIPKLINLRPTALSSGSQTPSAFTFALNSKNKPQCAQDMKVPSPLSQEFRRTGKEKQENELKETQNELFHLERDLAQLSQRIRNLLNDERENKSSRIIEQLHQIKEIAQQKEERINRIRKQRDSLLDVLF